jgi:hypothetical protein
MTSSGGDMSVEATNTALVKTPDALAESIPTAEQYRGRLPLHDILLSQELAMVT